jgi:hypothetical protein
MKITCWALIFVFFTIIFASCSSNIKEEQNIPKQRTGKYLGQIFPDTIPQFFALDYITTGMFEMNGIFHPNGNEFYYSISDPYQNYNSLLCVTKSGNVWGDPQIASFSGIYSDFDPFIGSDTNKLYFISRRTLNQPAFFKDADIWMTERINGKWQNPLALDTLINSKYDEYFVTLSDNGNLYFSSLRPGGVGMWNIYRAINENGKYTKVELLPEPLNSKFRQWDPYISRDESYMIFVSDRPGGYGGADLYISFLNNEVWSEPHNLGPMINTSEYEFCPTVTPDNKFFFFVRFGGNIHNFKSDKPHTFDEYSKAVNSPLNGLGNIMWVRSNFIQKLQVLQQ